MDIGKRWRRSWSPPVGLHHCLGATGGGYGSKLTMAAAWKRDRAVIVSGEDNTKKKKRKDCAAAWW